MRWLVALLEQELDLGLVCVVVMCTDCVVMVVLGDGFFVADEVITSAEGSVGKPRIGATVLASCWTGTVVVVAGSLVARLVDSTSDDPLTLKTIILADPEVTVTIQKAASPAPVAVSALLTPPKPFTVGSMLHGRPTQSPVHSIMSPKVGLTPP